MREYLTIKQSINKNVFINVYHVADKKSLVSLIHLSIGLKLVMNVSYYGYRMEFLYLWTTFRLRKLTSLSK